LSVRFNVPVDLSTRALAVTGNDGSAYRVREFKYDLATNTASWTLDRPVVRDRLRLQLSAAGVTNFDGQPLDGDFTDASRLPSGDGAEGGDFRFRLNVLPGDVNSDGRVSAADLLQVRQRLFRSASVPGPAQRGYSPFFDVDTDGRIAARDMATVRSNLVARLWEAVELPAADFSVTEQGLGLEGAYAGGLPPLDASRGPWTYQLLDDAAGSFGVVAGAPTTDFLRLNADDGTAAPLLTINRNAQPNNVSHSRRGRQVLYTHPTSMEQPVTINKSFVFQDGQRLVLEFGVANLDDSADATLKLWLNQQPVLNQVIGVVETHDGFADYAIDLTPYARTGATATERVVDLHIEHWANDWWNEYLLWSHFRTTGSGLFASGPASSDYETSPEKRVVVAATNSAGDFVQRSYTVRVRQANEAPAPPLLSSTDIPVGAGAGSAIGQLDSVDPEGDAIFYSLTGNANGFAVQQEIHRETLLNAASQTSAMQYDGSPLWTSYRGRAALRTHPNGGDSPAFLRGSVALPAGRGQVLRFAVTNHDPSGNWALRVLVNGERLVEKTISEELTGGGWYDVSVDLSRYAGTTINLELQNAATGWWREWAYWGGVSVENAGVATLVLVGSAPDGPVPLTLRATDASGNASESTVIVRPSTPKFVKISPTATYLRSDTAEGAVPISLAALGIQPGDTIWLQETGDFTPDLAGGTADSFRDLLALFSSSAVLLGRTELNRASGALATTLPGFVTDATYYERLSTDIPQDFRVSTGGTVVKVPAGAAYLFAASYDIFYGDNGDPDQDYGLTVLKIDPNALG
jgi:hypothetical protein